MQPLIIHNMASTTNPSVTILGATGGSGLAILRLCLQAKLQTTVLVRNESKLLNLLSSIKGEEESAKSPTLRIVQGSIEDADKVRNALTTPSGHLSDVVISSLGITPPSTLKGMWDPFKGANVNICRDGAQLLLGALASLRADGRKLANGDARGPLVVAYSTTGISDAGRDIPLHMVPLYHGLLGVPHDDKRSMEREFRASELRWVLVRPSLLFGTGSDDFPERKVRVMVERDGKFGHKELGTYITREACAQWVFRQLLLKSAGTIEYELSAVCLTF